MAMLEGLTAAAIAEALRREGGTPTDLIQIEPAAYALVCEIDRS